MLREHVVLRRIDQRDIPVPKPHQPLGGLRERSLTVEVEIREHPSRFAAPMRHEGHAPIEQVTNARIVPPRPRQQDPIDPM
jgi:hypothetical protein